MYPRREERNKKRMDHSSSASLELFRLLISMFLQCLRICNSPEGYADQSMVCLLIDTPHQQPDGYHKSSEKVMVKCIDIASPLHSKFNVCLHHELFIDLLCYHILFQPCFCKPQMSWNMLGDCRARTKQMTSTIGTCLKSWLYL